MSSSKEKAEEDLRLTLHAQNTIGGSRVERNAAIARNIMREEIGAFGDWDGARYSFDNQTRDRLLAHARQDAAYAAINSSDALAVAMKTLRTVRIVLGTQIVLAGITIWLNW